MIDPSKWLSPGLEVAPEKPIKGRKSEPAAPAAPTPEAKPQPTPRGGAEDGDDVVGGRIVIMVPELGGVRLKFWDGCTQTTADEFVIALKKLVVEARERFYYARPLDSFAFLQKWDPDTNVKIEGNGRWQCGIKPIDALFLVVQLIADHAMEEHVVKCNGSLCLSKWLLGYLRTMNVVDYAGPVPGWLPGIYDRPKITDGRCLVTQGTLPFQPTKGDFPTIKKLNDYLFTEGSEKWERIITLLRCCYNRILTDNKIMRAPALVICGAKGIGKSCWVDAVVSPLFGGHGNPDSVLGGEMFNAEVFDNHMLFSDDPNIASKFTEAEDMAVALKRFTANDKHVKHEKNKTKVPIRCRWLTIIALNDDEDSVSRGVPNVFAASCEDKIIAVHVGGEPGSFPFPEAEGADGQLEFANKVISELPGFLHWTLNEFKPTRKLGDTRYEVRGWVDEEMRAVITRNDTYEDLLAEIDLSGFWGAHQHAIAGIRGPASFIYAKLNMSLNSSGQRAAPKLGRLGGALALGRIFHKASVASGGKPTDRLQRLGNHRWKNGQILPGWELFSTTSLTPDSIWIEPDGVYQD